MERNLFMHIMAPFPNPFKALPTNVRGHLPGSFSIKPLHSHSLIHQINNNKKTKIDPIPHDHEGDHIYIYIYLLIIHSCDIPMLSNLVFFLWFHI